jgi:hypothetical protein
MTATFAKAVAGLHFLDRDRDIGQQAEAHRISGMQWWPGGRDRE